MNANPIWIFLLFFFFFSCVNETKQESTTSIDETQTSVEISESRSPFVVNMAYFRLRDSAGTGGEVLKMLGVGDTVFYLDQKSDFTTKINLRGLGFEEPWLRVETTDGTQGWIYAGGLNVFLNGEEELPTSLIKGRLTQLFGAAMADSVFNYRKQWRYARTAVEFAAAYRMGNRFRDILVEDLHAKLEIDDYEKRPDLSWLEEAMPGYVVHLVAEGTTFHLFQNYQQMIPKARQTNGREDDEFVEVCLATYPIDSIEHFYAGWFLQTWDYGGHSELGSGIHFNLLEKMNRTLAQSDLFEPEIEDLKRQLLHDITHSEITYWNTETLILKELDKIINTDFGILTEADEVTLRTRRKMFESSEKNGIQVNHRAGIHNM